MKFLRFLDPNRWILLLAVVLGCLLLCAGCAHLSKPTIGISGSDETRPLSRP